MTKLISHCNAIRILLGFLLFVLFLWISRRYKHDLCILEAEPSFYPGPVKSNEDQTIKNDLPFSVDNFVSGNFNDQVHNENDISGDFNDPIHSKNDVAGAFNDPIHSKNDVTGDFNDQDHRDNDITVDFNDQVKSEHFVTGGPNENKQDSEDTSNVDTSSQDEPPNAPPTESTKPSICQVQTRASHIRDVCRSRDWGKEKIEWAGVMAGSMLIVDDKHKLLYCMIPKTATHTFRYLLATLAIGKLGENMLYPIMNYLNHTGFRFLHQLEDEERNRIIRDYVKIVAVRHPFDRVRSAYENKMRRPGGLNAQVLKRNVPIINDYMETLGMRPDFDPNNDTISFNDFLYLLSKKYRDGFHDEHWHTFYRLCRPCTIFYDYVFRVETLDTDIKVLNKYFEDQGIHVPEQSQHRNVEMDSVAAIEKLSVTTEAFNNIDPDIVKGLLDVYARDFGLFGYQWSREGGATCSIKDDSGRSCC